MSEQLTGRTRYRIHTQWRKKPVLVLQVERTWAYGPPDSNGMPVYLSGKGWRDARVEDLPPPKETQP